MGTWINPEGREKRRGENVRVGNETLPQVVAKLRLQFNYNFDHWEWEGEHSYTEEIKYVECTGICQFSPTCPDITQCMGWCVKSCREKPKESEQVVSIILGQIFSPNQFRFYPEDNGTSWKDFCKEMFQKEYVVAIASLDWRQNWKQGNYLRGYCI